MKFYIFHLDRLSPCRSTCCLKHYLVIKTEPQLRHPAKIAFEFDRTQNFGAQDVSGGRNEEVERLNDVKKDLVFAVSDSFAAP